MFFFFLGKNIEWQKKSRFDLFPKAGAASQDVEKCNFEQKPKANGKKLELSETEAEEGEYVSKSSRLNGLVKTDQLWGYPPPQRR